MTRLLATGLAPGELEGPRKRAQEKSRAIRTGGVGATIGVARPAVNRNRRPVSPGTAAAGTALLLALAAVASLAQTREPLDQSRVRAMARQAARESRGDATELVLGLDRRVRERWGDFESFPLSVVRTENLLVTVTAPYMAFRRHVVDVLRTGRPVETASWVGTIVVAIAPARLGAPDIDSVLVTRDDRPVPPVRSELRPMTFSDGTGAEGVLHAGEVHFATSAFAPSGAVVLTLTPRAGAPMVYTFSDTELGSLR